MKLLFSTIYSLLLFSMATLSAFAHETDVVHEEPVPTISPILLIWIVIGLGVGGFLLWRFVLRHPKSSSPRKISEAEKTPPAQEKTVSQSDEKKSP